MKPPIYTTERFTFRAYSLKDEERFVEMGMDPIAVQFMGGATGIAADERALFHSIFKLYEKKDGARWFWIWGVYEEGRLCAHFELKETENTAENELEIVYMVHPAERKRGLMTAILAFLKRKQSVWNRQIIATVSPENIHSIALLEKWGISKKEWVKVEGEQPFLKVWLEQSEYLPLS